MDEQDAESTANEALLHRTRVVRDKLKPFAAHWRERGLEVDAVLVACDRLIAFLEGRSEEWVEVGAFLEKVQAFSQELTALANLERQAQRAEAVGSIPGMLDDAEELASSLSHPNDARTGTTLMASAQAARERLTRGEVPREELEEILLCTHAQAAELSRRNHFRAAALALFWESRPPEWWAQLTPRERKELEDLLGTWRAQRERILGELPIEDRRRLEALRPEDFDTPGKLEP